MFVKMSAVSHFSRSPKISFKDFKWSGKGNRLSLFSWRNCSFGREKNIQDSWKEINKLFQGGVMKRTARCDDIFDWPWRERLRLLLHRPVPATPEGGVVAAGRGGWGCGGRFSNNYIELRWWWVAMVTAVPSVSYDWKQPGNRAMQPGSLSLGSYFVSVLNVGSLDHSCFNVPMEGRNRGIHGLGRNIRG